MARPPHVVPRGGAAARMLASLPPMKTNRFALLSAAVLVSACSDAANEAPQFVMVADVPGIMTAVLEPAAEVYWDAVGSILDADGVHEFQPETDEEWEAVRNAAFVIAESGNLLMMDGRALDQSAWPGMARALIEVGQLAIEAAESRDPAAVFDAGAEVYYVCTGCHSAYALETLRPSDTPSN